MIGFLLRFAFFAIAIAAGRGPGLVAAVAAHEICSLLWRVARAEEKAAERRALYRKGFDDARARIESIQSVRATWGPKATPDDGVALGLMIARQSFWSAAERRAAGFTDKPPDTGRKPVDVREWLKALEEKGAA